MGHTRASLRKYRLRPEDHARMVSLRQGRCAICEQPRKLVVDHNHSTGEPRDLLCDGCNRGLGYFKEDPASLRRAADYLLAFAVE